MKFNISIFAISTVEHIGKLRIISAGFDPLIGKPYDGIVH